MGNCCANEFDTVDSTRTRKRLGGNFDEIMENDGGQISQKQYDDREVEKLRRELFEKPQIFVLNNLLMSVMFFENFEKEKNLTRITTETNMTENLLRTENTECVTPDNVFDNVTTNVKFRRLHGPNKNQEEPLVPRRMYLVNNNVEVVESNNVPQYSAIDKPSYLVEVEHAEKHIGFVKLKFSQAQPRQIIKPDQEPEEPKPGPSHYPDDTSEVYDYTTIANVNTPKPLNITTFERRDTLPKTCFAIRKIKKLDDKNVDSDDDSDYETDEGPIKQELFELITYVSSSGFMNHFQNAVFPNSLGKTLRFEMSDILKAKAIPGKIFCNIRSFEDELETVPCEIIPAVTIQWPIMLTFEFHDRAERTIMWDKFGVEYKWPKSTMINDIRSLNCVLVPRGYIPKRGENPDCDIEWEVAFPQAQRYLDMHMSHTQFRAFLFLLILYKSYIEPSNQKYDGLLVDHIRTHMYWECESNPRDWPEHRLGTKIVLIIQNFIHKLSTGKLNDFFIARKNTFSNVPNKYLNHAQKVFHEVLESPVLHFIGALRNLKYTSSKFYPTLDFKTLYAILTSSAKEFINPRHLDIRPPNMMNRNRKPAVDGDTNYKKDVRWKIKQEKINREKFINKQKQSKEKEENLKNERRGSVDSIDLEWQCEKEFDRFKIRALLEFFIKHFIEMARKSRRMANQRQALFFLKQANYLTRILETSGLEADAKEIFEIITKEEDISKKISISESFDQPPSTPKRNSLQFTNWEMTQQVKGNNINLNNLNKSYNNTAVPTANNFSKLKKQPSNLKVKPGVLRSSTFLEERPKSTDSRRSIVFSDTVEVR